MIRVHFLLVDSIIMYSFIAIAIVTKKLALGKP